MTTRTIGAAMATETDLLRIDDQLGDEERLIRDTVRSFVADHVLPEIADWFEAGMLPRSVLTELGKLGLFGMHLTGYGCAGTGPIAYGVAGHVPDLEVRQRGAERGVAAADGGRRSDRLLRADRARPRIRPGLDAHP